MSAPFTLQWSLDTTAGSTLSIAAGVLKAATSDNVQPLALLACEAFGANLAMSPEICLKMEQLARRRHTTHVTKYLGMIIGYASGDCADHLASTEAGVRFLGFAAVLDAQSVPASYFEPAMVLHELLDASSATKQLLPTIRQLQELLKAISCKTGDSGFSDEVCGWARWLYHSIPHQSTHPFEISIVPPDSKGYLAITKALAELERVGQVAYIAISASWPAVPWLIAFIKWITGRPPDVSCMGKAILGPAEISASVTLDVLLDVEVKLKYQQELPYGGSPTFRIQTFVSARLSDLLWAHDRQMEFIPILHHTSTVETFLKDKVLEFDTFRTAFASSTVQDPSTVDLLLCLAQNIPERIVLHDHDLTDKKSSHGYALIPEEPLLHGKYRPYPRAPAFKFLIHRICGNNIEAENRPQLSMSELRSYMGALPHDINNGKINGLRVEMKFALNLLAGPGESFGGENWLLDRISDFELCLFTLFFHFLRCSLVVSSDINVETPRVVNMHFFELRDAKVILLSLIEHFVRTGWPPTPTWALWSSKLSVLVINDVLELLGFSSSGRFSGINRSNIDGGSRPLALSNRGRTVLTGAFEDFEYDGFASLQVIYCPGSIFFRGDVYSALVQYDQTTTTLGSESSHTDLVTSKFSGTDSHNHRLAVASMPSRQVEYFVSDTGDTKLVLKEKFVNFWFHSLPLGEAAPRLNRLSECYESCKDLQLGCTPTYCQSFRDGFGTNHASFDPQDVRIWPSHGNAEHRQMAISVFCELSRRVSWRSDSRSRAEYHTFAIFLHTTSCLSCLCKKALELLDTSRKTASQRRMDSFTDMSESETPDIAFSPRDEPMADEEGYVVNRTQSSNGVSGSGAATASTISLGTLSGGETQASMRDETMALAERAGFGDDAGGVWSSGSLSLIKFAYSYDNVSSLRESLPVYDFALIIC